MNEGWEYGRIVDERRDCVCFMDGIIAPFKGIKEKDGRSLVLKHTYVLGTRSINNKHIMGLL